MRVHVWLKFTELDGATPDVQEVTEKLQEIFGVPARTAFIKERPEEGSVTVRQTFLEDTKGKELLETGEEFFLITGRYTTYENFLTDRGRHKLDPKVLWFSPNNWKKRIAGIKKGKTPRAILIDLDWFENPEWVLEALRQADIEIIDDHYVPVV